jgi:hypothetical protein
MFMNILLKYIFYAFAKCANILYGTNGQCKKALSHTTVYITEIHKKAVVVNFYAIKNARMPVHYSTIPILLIIRVHLDLKQPRLLMHPVLDSYLLFCSVQPFRGFRLLRTGFFQMPVQESEIKQ